MKASRKQKSKGISVPAIDKGSKGNVLRTGFLAANMGGGSAPRTPRHNWSAAVSAGRPKAGRKMY
jgi:hypothetical protein